MAMKQDAVLKEAWEQYAVYDSNAIRQQKTFKQLQNAILALGVIAVLLAVIQTQFFGVDPEVAQDIPGYMPWYAVLRWGIIIAPILIAALIAVTNQFKSGNKWLMLRSGAESLKREMFRYRAQAGIYSDEGSADTTPEQKLADKLTKIRRQVMKTAVSEAGLKPHGQTMPSDMGVLSSSDYIDRRLEDQRRWYEGKTGGLEKKMQRLQWLTILIGSLGTLLAAVGFELWVAVTAALAAALATYLEYTRTESTLVLYNQVATDLKNIVTWWNALPSDEQALASNHNLLVQQTEQALESEHSGWVQNMTEALTELQEQQAAMKDQVTADVQAVYGLGAARQDAFVQQRAEAQAKAEAEAEPEEPEESEEPEQTQPEDESSAAQEEATAPPESTPTTPAEPVSKALTEADYIAVADELGVELAAMKAVAEVEASGGGFDKEGRPKILFEGHIFWRRLKAQGIDPAPLVPGNENVLHSKWTRQYYREDQYERLEKARTINEDAALEAASWGMFQVLGQNWEQLGYASAKAFVELMYKSEGEHLRSFARFVKANNLVQHLKNLDWAKFARGYNGPGYAQNKYDTRMAAAYEKHKT